MAKVSRLVLKKLVKECLVEILFEGLDDDNDEVLEESTRPRPRKSRQRRKEAEEFQRVAVERKKMLRERTSRKQVDGKKLASQITSDPVLAEIFAQTAQTTLPGMINADNRKGHYPTPSDGAAKMVQENDLDDLFEGAGNWATLAFSSKTKPG